MPVTHGWIPTLILSLLASAPSRKAVEPTVSLTAPVDLKVETLRVDAGGTETLFTDEARIFLGKGALLEREVTLTGRTSGRLIATEKLRLRAELHPLEVSEGGLSLALSLKVRVLATSGGTRLPRGESTRALSLQIARGASELVTVYESVGLGAKVTLNLRWSLPEEAEPEADAGVPVELAARIFELGESGETLLADNHLLALVGHSASTTFDRLVPLSGGQGENKKARQDRMEITLTPRYLLGKSLSLTLEVSGELVTLTSEGNHTHPLAHQGNYLLSSGVPASADLEVSSDSEVREGWGRVRFRLEVAASY